MHRCWHISELRHKIFESLGEHGEDPNIELSRLAVTCREFHVDAVDLLWEVQYGVDNLLKCLPPTTWKIHDGRFIIVSRLMKENWDRVLYYSSKIKYFSDEPRSPKALILDVSVFKSICLRVSLDLSPVPLLPNLRALECHTSSPLFLYLPSLVGSDFLGIDSEIPLTDSTWWFPNWPKLASCCHALEVLTIHNDDNEGNRGSPEERRRRQEWASCFILTLDCANLRSISVGDVTREAYSYISHLKNLEVMRIRRLPDDKSCLDDVALPALRKLWLEQSDSASITILLDHLRAESLDFVRLSAIQINIPLESTPGEFITKILSCCSSLCTTVDIRVDADSAALQSAGMNPLLELSNLKMLHLSYPTIEGIDDAFVERMASAWPNLIELWINSKTFIQKILPRIEGASGPDNLPKMAVLSIYLCKNIQYLVYPTGILQYIAHMDATGTIDIPVQDTHSPPIRNLLKSFNAGHSPIGDPAQVAIFLLNVFPKLSTIECSLPRKDQNKIKWSVNTVVSAFCIIDLSELDNG
ncbi:hypothetical protein R3P38DRAFT_3360599 [Favolaschia claudopus]|uniref:F-box domain-containing protein n=1 Tax=Favolaschia claudopus TaxID=2862362 RepID=A0AAW0AX75_9AGAR